MLQMMRNLAQTWVVKGLMLLLMISFAIWGIGDIFRGNPLKRDVAKIGNVSISVSVLENQFSQTLTRAHIQVSPDLSRQQAVQMGLLEGALNTLIDDAGIKQEVEKLGLSVSNKQFLTTLATMPQFITPDGKFNKDLFVRNVQGSGMSERDYFEMATTSMSRQQLFNVIRSQTHVPHGMMEDLYRAKAQKRVLDIVTIKDDSFGNVAVPDEAALKAFYEQNQSKFVAPEYRGLTIGRLSVDDVAKDISVSDDDVRKEYDARPAPVGDQERRDVVQVMAPDLDKAKQLSGAAKNNGDLTAVAKGMKLDPLALDKIEQKGLLPGLTSQIFALKEHEVSAPIEGPNGWQVVQVKKVYSIVKPSFEAEKDKIRTALQHDRAIEKLSTTINNLDDQLAAGHALEDIANTMGLHVTKISALSAAGKAPDGQDVAADMMDGDLVLKAAFSQAAGETSPVLDDKQGHYAVVRTDDVTPAAVPPLDKLKDSVSAEWIKAERAKRAAAEADTIAKGLRDGKAPSSFAGETGVSIRVSKPISRMGDSDADLPDTILMEVFRMKKDDVVVTPMPDSQIVMRLSQLIDADPGVDKNGVDKLTTEKRERAPEELVAEYVKYMRVLYPVEIYQNVLDNMRQQGG